MNDPGLILVSGGAGVVGSRLVRGLVRAGRRVRVLTLPGDPAVSRLDDLACEIVRGDVGDAATLAGVFDGVGTVYHLAAVILARDPSLFRRINVEGTRHMVEGAAAAGARHFIHVSSAAAANPRGSAYAQSKLDAEAWVKSRPELAFTIVRPTLVYGNGGGQEYMLFQAALLRYPVVPFIGSGRSRKNPVHVDDLVDGLLAIAGNPAACGKTYNFSGGEAITMRDLARLVLRRQGVTKPFMPIPVPVCRAAAAILERILRHPPLTRYAISRFLDEAATDNAEARADLGYNPVGVSEGLCSNSQFGGLRQ